MVFADKFILLLAVASALLLSGLGRFALKDYDEATYALVSAEMAESGNYLYLTHNGNPWLDKPPLLFWLIGASISVFGFNEFSLRLPGALIGLATVVLTYALARSLTGNRNIALLSAGILLATSQFIYSARELRFDVPVGFGILLAVYSFFRSRQKPLWYIGVGAGLAAAILFKSIFAVFIPLLILIFSFVYHDWRWLRQPLFWLSVGGGLLLVLPWHLLQYRAYGDTFVNTYLGRHGFARYTDPFLGARNASPAYFFVLAGKVVEPWFALFCFGSLWFIFRRQTKTMRESKLYQPILATLLSSVAIIGVLSFSKSKLFYYFDPVYPFLAIFIGLMLVFWREKMTRFSPKTYALIISLVLLFGLTNTVWQVAEIRGWPRGAGEYALTGEEREVSRILNKQTASSKLYTMLHFYWDTIRFYTRDRAVPIEINALGETIDADAFFLLIPTVVLKSIEIHPLIRELLETVFDGEHLTLFMVRALEPITNPNPPSQTAR